MELSEYHPFYSDDVPFASLPCAVRTASPALCHGYWGCAAGLAGETLGLQGMLYGHRPYRHPNKPGSEQEQLWGPSMPGSSGQGCLGSMAGRLCLGGHSVHLQVQQILLPLQQLAGGKGQSSYMVSRGSSQHSFHQFHTNCK